MNRPAESADPPVDESTDRPVGLSTDRPVVGRAGLWLTGTLPVLRLLSTRLSADPTALRRHAEDLWAASRHHRFKRAADQQAVAAWGELPRSLRFAAQSAERGRPRPGLVAQAFERVIAAEGNP